MQTIIEERQNRREKTEIDNNKTKHEKGETRILYLNGQQLCVPEKIIYGILAEETSKVILSRENYACRGIVPSFLRVVLVLLRCHDGIDLFSLGGLFSHYRPRDIP